VKILFLSSSLAAKFGGAAISESSLCGKLSLDHELVLLSRSARADLDFAKKQGIKNVVCFKPTDLIRAFFDSEHPLSKLIRWAEVFHLNGHWFWENYFFARLCYRYGVPYVLHPRGMLWVSYRRPVLKRVFNVVLGNWIVSHASKVVLLSEFEKSQLYRYPVVNKKLIVIPNGIELPEFSTDCIAARKKYFLYLGRLEPRKNLEFLIRSFKKVIENNSGLSLRLIGPVERHYDQALKKLIFQLGLSDVVTIEDPVYGNEKAILLSNALAVVYPAKGEPFGRTVFEAFAAGTLCLIPQNSGGAEYVNIFAPEMLYPDQSEDILADKMLTISMMEQEERSLLVTKAQEWVKRNLDWQSVTERVLEVYRVVLKQPEGMNLKNL